MFKPKAHGVPLAALAMAVSQGSYAAAVPGNDSFNLVQGAGPYYLDVLANDTSDTGGTVYISSWDQTSAAYGTITYDEGLNELVYTPPTADFTGQDTFTYYATDDTGYGDYATVTLDVVAGSVAGEGPITSSVTGAANKSTATMLDKECAKSSNEVPPALYQACQVLLGNPANINDLVSQIAPDELLVMRHVVSSVSSTQSAHLFQYQQSLHGGGTGSHLAVNSGSIRLQSYRGGAAGDQNSPWGVFATAHTNQSNHDSSGYEAGYDSQDYGMTVGADYRFMPTLFVGAAFDWMRSNVTYDRSAGGVDSDLYSLTGFLTWYRKQLSVDMQLGYTSGNFSTQRNMTFPVVATASGDTNSNQYNLSLQTDWTWSRGPWTARPYLRFQYLESSVDGYTETSNGPWAMQVGKQDLKQTSTSLGASLTYALSFKWGVMVPGFKASAVSESSSDYSPVSFHLVADSSSDGAFSLQPESEDNLFYQYELSSVFELTNGLSTFLQVGMLSGYSHLSAYQVTTGFHLEL